MRTFTCLCSLCCLVAALGAAEETRLPSRTVSVGLFKNGLGVVTCEVTVPGPGTYIVADAPTPVHGTFWVTGGDDVIVRVAQREVSETATTDRLLLRRDLAGKQVILHLAGDRPETIAGRLRRSDEPEQTWARGYEQPRWGYGYYGGWNPDANASAVPVSPFLLLDTDDGPRFVRETAVEQVEVSDQLRTVLVKKPVLILEVTGASKVIRYGFLTKGLSWAPSYHLDITGTNLALRQKAVIRNEYADLEDVELLAVSGFPHMPFSHVDAPLAPGATWSGFFQQLNQQVGGQHAAMGNRMVTQQVAYNGSAPDAGLCGPPVPDGEQGVDLHFQSLGRYRLPAGEALACLVAKGTTTGQALVEWDIPDLRAPNGRIVDDWQRQQAPEKFEDNAWDAITFTNPFDFPMTTAAMTITREGRFAGQTLSYFVNPKGATSARINKALSIGVRQNEVEVAESRKTNIPVNHHTYTRVTLEGRLVIRNNRAAPVTILVNRRLSGEVVANSEAPSEDRLLDEGAQQVNQRHELRWRFALKAGEEKEITYRYTVLEW